MSAEQFGQMIFAPLLGWPLLIGLAVAAMLLLGLSFWRHQPGILLRAVGWTALLAALSGPSLLREERQPLSDIIIAVVDETASQALADRPAQTAAALAHLQAETAARTNTELRVIHLPDGAGDDGSLMMHALSEALSAEPLGRIAGIILISDGRLHDLDYAPLLPAPTHLLLTGTATDWDRRLIVRNAPAYAILGEQITLTLRIDDQGAGPQAGTLAQITISIDGGPPLEFQVPTGEDVTLPLTLPHGGMNVLQFSTPLAEGELTDRNNGAVIQINGLRDRLRVLLVSGEPHPGERTWRNLLKADASVDLVHFTILRPPEKQDGVPVDELSLIAFPTRELFIEKIHEFDLIIFDRYRRRGILPSDYLDNVASYVRQGGAVLVASGPEYASAESIYRSPLGVVLPGAPTARVGERGYRPTLPEAGLRHPVTAGLEGAGDDETAPLWGRWFRWVDVTPAPDAVVVMTAPDDAPLLLLNRVGEGRVALLASDQAWLWDRGYEGGGPQQELLRRLAHWLMKEPELEEEALWAEPAGQSMRIVRRTMAASAPDAVITHPDGSQSIVALTEITPGQFEANWDAPEIGLYRLASGDEETVIALGPAAPREFVETIADSTALAPLIAPTGGVAVSVENGLPDLRDVRVGRPAAGRGWIGIVPRGAFQTADISIKPLLPAWVLLLIGAVFVIGAWLREGRRG
ncbi:MAG: hypothetical protein JKX69_10975 [Rhodobacteraceae bacterium]|nr:hypothetical protein [Paracoccaceae bacterium]